jgi:putative sugar O-methyltransferase
MQVSEISQLWQSLSKTLFDKIDDEFVSSFRRPGGANGRLGSWDPFDKTMRYFKFMLFSAAERETDVFFKHYSALGNVDVGAPVFVKVRGCAVNIDYLMAVQEFMFLESSDILQSVRSIVEIGAGFGRSCHALLALSPKIEKYTIIDLPNMLELSRRVLSLVIPDLLQKVEFLDAEKPETWGSCRRDLAINIDSFQEMRPSTIDRYMTDVVAGCGMFYVKNPIAKYAPGSVGIESSNANLVNDVFSLGYCREIIDIFDDVALARARRNYIDAYRPSIPWRLVAERPAELFPYYHHAIYRAP